MKDVRLRVQERVKQAIRTVRRKCPKASREWRATLYRRAKLGVRLVRMSPKMQMQMLHRRVSMMLKQRKGVDRG